MNYYSSKLLRMNLINLLKPIIELSVRAGESILRIYDTEFKIDEKKDLTPLTEADLHSHNIIVSGLKSITPDIPIISEEEKLENFSSRKRRKQYWLIDPLDGTREFINKNGEFTVNIALIENNIPVLGIVHVPVKSETYIGCKNFGAKKINAMREMKDIAINKKLNTPLKIVGSRSHRGDSLTKFLNFIGEYEFLSVGSSLKFCMIAEGKADLYPRFGPTSEWDTAAAQAVVEQAGGVVINRNLDRLLYNKKECILNSHFYVVGSNLISKMISDYENSISEKI